MRSPASMERPGIIYLATNKVNGKLYVGKTAREFVVRIREHEYDARNKSKTAFSRAIAKYGIEAFNFEVLETCPAAEIDERERFWISQHPCRKPHGYNLTDGGDGTTGLKRPDVTARLSAMTGERNHAFGKKHTPEENEKNRQALLGAKNPRFGKPVSPELRALISQRTKEAMQRPEVREKYISGRRAVSVQAGKKLSETRKRLFREDPSFRAKYMGKVKSPELRSQISANLKEWWSSVGKFQKRKPFSPESIEKMSQSAKARWAKKKEQKKEAA